MLPASRRPRKQSCPQRSAEDTDGSLGRILTLNFGWVNNPRYQFPDSTPVSRRSSCRSFFTDSSILTESGHELSNSGSSQSSGSDAAISHLFGPFHQGYQMKHDLNILSQSEDKSKHLIHATSDDPIACHASSEHETVQTKSPYSLANQYLDTMVRDDHWRKLCLRKIRQARRKIPLVAQSLQPSASNYEPLSPISERRSSFDQSRNLKRKNTKRIARLPPTPPISPKPSTHRRRSLDDSDSGFVSSSPSPHPHNTKTRSRSNRKCSIETTTPTPLIDIPASMVGRSCLSCGCTNTTCWRRSMGGIICNSCGLRLPRS